MASNPVTKIDSRIADIISQMHKLEGQLQGLRFARSLVLKEQPDREAEIAKSKQSPSAATISVESSTGRGPSVKSYVLQALDQNTSGLAYTKLVTAASQIAGRELNPKTVSSSLDELKKKRKVASVDGVYKRIPAAGEPAVSGSAAPFTEDAALSTQYHH